MVADTVRALKNTRTGPSAAVIIPARNEALRLGACLESVHQAIAKVPAPVDVVVVDDDSTDATAEVARAGGATVVHQRPRRGPLSAWMLGVEATAAPLLVLVDADCRIGATALVVLFAGFDNAKVGVVAGRSQPVGPGGSAGIVARSANFSSILLHCIKTRLWDHDFLPIGKLMAVRRAAWQVADPDLVPCDRAVAHLARSAGWEIAYAPEALVYFSPVTNYRALREDYLRTNTMAGPLPSDYDPLPRSLVVRAACTAAVAAPIDAVAWAACRTILFGDQAIRPRQPALSSWPG